MTGGPEALEAALKEGSVVIDWPSYIAAERACIEAERAYFAAIGWPPNSFTTPVEESDLGRRFREARERERPTREEGAR